jgi:hypothetical protein
MDDKDFKQLEQFIQSKLSNLPDRKAPEDFAEVVFARIARSQSRWWWQRPFNYWPKPAQAALHVSLTAIFLCLVYAGSSFMGELSVGASSFGAQMANIGLELANLFMACGKICWAILSRASLDSLAVMAGALAIAYAGCVGLGVALYKVAFRPLQTA